MKNLLKLCLIGGLLFVGCSKKEGPKEVVQHFINDAFINKNYSALEKYATPDTVNLFKFSLALVCNVKQKGYEECYKEMMDSKKIKKIEIGEVKKINDKHVIVTAKEYLSNGGIKTANFDVFLINGKWKVGVEK